MTATNYRLPDGNIPVLLTSDTAELVPGEAAALLSYAADHPDIDAQAIASMLFRTRMPRKHRALAMVANRDELLSALRAVTDGREHPAVVRTTAPATTRRLAYVFPGQGGQRPGMGRLFYESVPAFRAEVDRCTEAFEAHLGQSPLAYLLDEHHPAEDNASTVQPALFTQMAGLAAMWRSFGIAPDITVGHSQGEIAAAYFSGKVTLADAVRVVGIRAGAADEFAAGDYAMAVIAADRDVCEDVLARCSGWAQLSVVNSPNMVGISGERQTVEAVVNAFTQRDVFARVIRVQFPAHTSLINQLGDNVRATAQRELQNPKFLDTDIECLGATLGDAITQELPVDEYWFWNLRNTVRFDKAVAAAATLGVDTFVELAEHPTLQLAIQENLAAGLSEDDDRTTTVVGTSNRTATSLGEFTHNLAQLALHDLNYSWGCLRIDTEGRPWLPLPDFPNSLTNDSRLWLPYAEVPTQGTGRTSTSTAGPAETAAPAHETVAPPRLLVEKWIRLSRRSLVRPRSIGLVDHTGAYAELVTDLSEAARELGATATLVTDNIDSSTDLNALVILLARSPRLDDGAAAAAVTTFFSDRAWWPGANKTINDCWLVTVGGEAVLNDDAPPDPVHAAAIAGLRSIGSEYPGVNFRHLDLPTAPMSSDAAATILSALHTDGESALAMRDGGLYAKRVVEIDADTPDSGSAPQHVLVIGGTGTLGLDFTEHFARRGARRITIVSRSGETATVAERLQHIRATTSTHIHVAACDVGDQAAVSLLARSNQDDPADLIIHAAVQYSGIELADITAEKVDQALRAKVVGIWRILQTFPRTADCRIILCSSVAATVGGRGLIIYAASNRMLDAMAHRLRADGVDCVAVQWGQWQVSSDPGNTGMAKLAFTGLLPMTAADALALGMSRLPGNAIIAAFDLDRARSVLETCGHAQLLSQLSAPLAEVTPSAQSQNTIGPAGLSHRLVNLLAGAIGVDRAETIDTTVPMVAIGLDSLQALELRRRVKNEFDHDLDVAELLGGASIADVVGMLGASTQGR
ncbi:Erythronolide synthase, modules 5 and 6 [Mycobacterium basiliense]|uniref:Erythronolide synthase, modules 5 and 6 n=1 Tax=Mycobacterium basiliense TaxID=2094119 RepID=A0A447GGQ9_9MYCO|nr:nocobactin polyketide synthase NbtC [Mycobacterium basiliense]VDM89701.1 Erythronolide synthase, modules 5 and 6 [Mycobacterium basiliense]